MYDIQYSYLLSGVRNPLLCISSHVPPSDPFCSHFCSAAKLRRALFHFLNFYRMIHVKSFPKPVYAFSLLSFSSKSSWKKFLSPRGNGVLEPQTEPRFPLIYLLPRGVWNLHPGFPLLGTEFPGMGRTNLTVWGRFEFVCAV
jgi:hypothetical protein